MPISIIQLKAGVLLAFTAMLLVCCSKKNNPLQPAGVVSITEALTGDTLGFQAPFEEDTVITMEFSATLKSGPSSSQHQVGFVVDTTQLSAYRAEYTDTVFLLPAAAYFVDLSTCVIPAGSAQSEPAQINIVKESETLAPSTTYVLPVVIATVDGQPNTEQPVPVLFLKIRTPPSLLLPKAGWSIVSASPSLLPATNLLDNSSSTAWVPSGTPPLYATIDMGQLNSFSRVAFSNSPIYITYGGTPTEVDIQVSTDNTTWTDKGNFPGTNVTTSEVVDIGPSTARYLKFIVLSQTSCLLGPYCIVGDVSAMQ